MLFNGREISFPAISKISFNKVFETLEKTAEDPDKNIAAYSSKLLSLAEQYPELRDGFEDLKLISEYKEPIYQLTRIMFPEVLTDNEIKAVVPPFNFSPLRVSRRFQGLIDSAGDKFMLELKDYTDDMMYIYGCYAILGAHFKFPMEKRIPSLMDLPDHQTGIMNSYRITFNADLIEMLPTEKSLEITMEDYYELMDNFNDIDKWKAKFPPDSWIMRGIGLITLTDVTMDSAISTITSNLLVKTEDSFEKIKVSLKRLLNIPKLKTGFIALENNAVHSTHKKNINCLIIDEDETVNVEKLMCKYSFDQLMQDKVPMVISDVDRFHARSQSPLSEKLVSLKLGSYIIAPLIHNDELLGFLEVASEEKNQLNSGTLKKIDLILPILSMAISRFKSESMNKIEAIIQQECTPIHASVKWRFEEEAYQYMIRQHHNEQPNFKDIIFKDVFPLYGQLDIKSSSSKRNEAVTSDLIKQINGVRKVLLKSFEKQGLLLFEELIFRIDVLKDEIEHGLLAGSEQKTLNFLNGEIYPVFNHLKESDKELADVVRDYESILDPELKTVYEKRRDFDESVSKINHLLSAHLDHTQIEAQNIFPHFFERYKTDGIEFNMYIGQSISKDKKFDIIYLRNLLIWQLKEMCEMEYKFRALSKDLPTPLELASLVLIYSTPLSVHFRMDEKKFDVEGAYNARYEIVKKRIDKAHIRGTEERITSPGKIAIIYSREQDALEYKKYINYLSQKGFLVENTTEELELDDLQGITGLKALRVEIDYNTRETNENGNLTVEEIIEVIEKQS